MQSHFLQRGKVHIGFREAPRHRVQWYKLTPLKAPRCHSSILYSWVYQAQFTTTLCLLTRHTLLYLQPHPCAINSYITSPLISPITRNHTHPQPQPTPRMCIHTPFMWLQQLAIAYRCGQPVPCVHNIPIPIPTPPPPPNKCIII